MIQELISKCFSNWKTRCLVLREVQMFIQDKAVRWKNLPCELSYYISGLHILRMDTCHTAFNFKVYECCCVSVVNSPELEWERRGTSRTILLPFSSYHRCPSSKIRPSKPVSPQLLSELYHIRFFFFSKFKAYQDQLWFLQSCSKPRIIFLPWSFCAYPWPPDTCPIKPL